MPFPLPIPPAAENDARSLEMIRVWLANKESHIVLNIGFWENRGWDEADSWGVLLADMIHHIANAHESEYGRNPQETIGRIRETFERELVRPTSGRMGEFIIEHNDSDTDEQ